MSCWALAAYWAGPGAWFQTGSWGTVGQDWLRRLLGFAGGVLWLGPVCPGALSGATASLDAWALGKLCRAGEGLGPQAHLPGWTLLHWAAAAHGAPQPLGEKPGPEGGRRFPGGCRRGLCSLSVQLLWATLLPGLTWQLWGGRGWHRSTCLRIKDRKQIQGGPGSFRLRAPPQGLPVRVWQCATGS